MRRAAEPKDNDHGAQPSAVAISSTSRIIATISSTVAGERRRPGGSREQ